MFFGRASRIGRGWLILVLIRFWAWQTGGGSILGGHVVGNLGLRHTQNSAWDNKTTLQGFPRGQGTLCSPERRGKERALGEAGLEKQQEKRRENGDAMGPCYAAQHLILWRCRMSWEQDRSCRGPFEIFTSSKPSTMWQMPLCEPGFEASEPHIFFLFSQYRIRRNAMQPRRTILALPTYYVHILASCSCKVACNPQRWELGCHFGSPNFFLRKP